MNWAVWARDKAPHCPDCRGIYALKNPPQEPPCDAECYDRVPLPENREAVTVYHRVQGQIIAIEGQIIDINHLAVWETIDRMKIIHPMEVFEKVTKLFRIFNDRDKGS